jgi:hypothetical protein
MKPTTALRYSMQETIENWLGSHSLEIKKIEVEYNEERDSESAQSKQGATPSSRRSRSKYSKQ